MVAVVDEIDLVLEEPKRRGEVIETLKSVRLHFHHLYKGLLGLLVLVHLEVASPQSLKHPACLLLFPTKFVQQLDRLCALEVRDFLQGCSKDL
jgi:hypothetical protein